MSKKRKAQLVAVLPELIQQHLDQIESELAAAEKPENPNDKILNLEKVKQNIDKAGDDVISRIVSIATELSDTRMNRLAAITDTMYQNAVYHLQKDYLYGFQDKLREFGRKVSEAVDRVAYGRPLEEFKEASGFEKAFNGSETLSQRFIAAAIGNLATGIQGMELPASVSAAITARLSGNTI